MRYERGHPSSGVEALSAAAVALLVVAAPVRADWPMYGHDAARSGVADGAGPSMLQVRWTVELGGRVDSSPAVLDGVVYVGTTEGNVCAVQAATGQIIWRQSLGGPVTSSPCVAEGLVFIGCVDTFAYALDAQEGTVAWRHRLGSAVVPSPAFYENNTYWASTAGRVVALRPTDGSEVWARALGARVIASPCLGNGALYIGDMGGTFHALRAGDGASLWEYAMWAPRGGPRDRILATAAFADSVVFAGSQDMWHGEPAPPEADPDQHLYAIEAGSGQVRWAMKLRGSVMGSPAVSGGVLFAAANEGYPSSRAAVYSIDVATGKARWRWPPKRGARAGVMHAAPAIAGNVAYFADLDGTVQAFNAQTGTVVSLFTTGGPVYSSPAISEGRLFIGSGDGKLYCF